MKKPLTAMSIDGGFLARWARIAARRRWWVLGSWVGVLMTVVILGRAFGGEFTTDFSIPGTESQQAFDLLSARFPQQAGDSATLVFKAEDGITTPTVRGQIEAVLEQARGLPGVMEVSSPYESRGGTASRDGRVAYATLRYAERARSVLKSDVEALFALTDSSQGDGLRVEVGGPVVQSSERQPPGTSEAVGLITAVFILLVAFGSVVAMGLPLATALFSLGTSFALIGLLANVLDLPTASSSFAGMLGIGVGIDYALFVVTRFREELRAGQGVEDSVAVAVSTAGCSVAVAGGVVVTSMLALVALGIPIASSLGIAMAIVVALAVLAALTLLPALLAFAGRRIDRWSISLFHPTDRSERSSVWYRLSQRIQRRPLAWFLGSLVLLTILAAPVLSMRLGMADAGNGSPSLHSRRAYDLLTEGFGPGFNGPLTVILDLKNGNSDPQESVHQVRTVLADWTGVVQVSPPRLNSAGDAAVVTVIPQTPPQDTATQHLVHNLRISVLPPVVTDTGIQVYVAGPTAASIDIGDRITSRMPLFFAAVIGLSFLLLLAVFRSVLVPLTAAVMNLLSMGAAYGVVVAVFQWGWLAEVIDIKTGPIESFLPMMLFAILFGLSMDYEIFLISRIREAYVRRRNNRDAIAHGLTVTARVITAAASVMVAVFLSFILGNDRIVKEFGLGLATAILVDATLVRLVLVPATMQLLGDANWWLPRVLDRLLPRLSPEAEPSPEISQLSQR